MHRALKFILYVAASGAAVCLAIWLFSEAAVTLAARGRLYSDINTIPKRKAALVLGTSKFVPGPGHRENLHYKYRIEAAAALFHAGKADCLIVSGNGADPHYNEPDTMRTDLAALGVPPDRIICDYAGLRTLDSVLRAAQIFGIPDCIAVSQPSHNERAIFIGRMHGQDMIGFNATNVPFFADPKTAIRERLARVLAVLDTLVLNKQPQVLGGKIRLGAATH